MTKDGVIMVLYRGMGWRYEMFRNYIIAKEYLLRKDNVIMVLKHKA